MKYLYTLAFSLLLLNREGIAQTTVYFRNNTWNNFSIEVNQHGPFQMDTADWSQPLSTFKRWNAADEAVFEVNRTAASIPAGDTALFDINLIANGDTATLRLMLVGGANGSALSYSAAAPGFSDTWYSDNSFHQFETTFGGKAAILKYKPDNDDSTYTRNLRFALHDTPAYEIPEADFQNPNVLNVMAYNIQMIPFGLSGLKYAKLRGDLLPAHISPYQDVVIFEEVFDDTAREFHLAPAMLAAGFAYRTTILNASTGALPWNGGVVIFSRWPIEFSDQWDYTMCGQNSADCYANKGVKYARINKLGKKYHIFGTHMDAGSQQDDINARLSNMREVRDFIAVQNIPQDEAVVFGGDFNISPTSNQYFDLLDTLHPVIPVPIGYENSTFSGGAGKIIDHVWGDGKHLIPLTATNEIITLRSIEDTMWVYSEFSDHRTALGRFVYPDFTKTGVDTQLCPGQNLMLAVNSSSPFVYQWDKNGGAVSGATSNELYLQNAQFADGGNYTCSVNYSVIFGNDTANSLIQYFFPSGPDTFNADIALGFGTITLICPGINERNTSQDFDLYPNPNNGKFSIDFKELKQNTSLTILSAMGKTFYFVQIEKELSQISLPALPAGLYVVVLKNDDGQIERTLMVE